MDALSVSNACVAPALRRVWCQLKRPQQMEVSQKETTRLRKSNSSEHPEVSLQHTDQYTSQLSTDLNIIRPQVGCNGIVTLRIHAAGMRRPSDFLRPGQEQPGATLVGEAEGPPAAHHLPRPTVPS